MDKQFSSFNLSQVQIQVLLLLMFAPTPRVAAATVSHNDRFKVTLDFLVKSGLAQTDPGGIIITQAGQESLDRVNAIDVAGQRTPFGDELFQKAVDLNNSDRQMETAYPLINSISQRV